MKQREGRTETQGGLVDKQVLAVGNWGSVTPETS